MQAAWLARLGGLMVGVGTLCVGVLWVLCAGQAAAQTPSDGTLVEPAGVRPLALAGANGVVVSADAARVLAFDGAGGRVQACRSGSDGVLDCLPPQAVGVPGEIRAMVLAPSGRYAYAAMRDGSRRFLAVFRVEQGAQALRYQQSLDVARDIDPQALAIAPGGARLYTGTPGRGLDMFIISLHDGSLSWHGASLSRIDVRGLALSPDGGTAYAIEPGGITRYKALPDQLPRMDYTPVPQVGGPAAVSPDGSHLYAVGADAGRGLVVVDLDSSGRPGAVRGATPSLRWLSGFALFPDGRRLVGTDTSPELAWWPVRAPMFPAGTYQASCSGARYDPASAILEASCAQPRDPALDSRLDYKLQCGLGSTVSNDNGKLVCDSLRWLPPGSWRAACRGIEFDGSAIRADCGSGATWSPGVELDYARGCPPNATVGFTFDPRRGGSLYCPAGAAVD